MLDATTVQWLGLTGTWLALGVALRQIYKTKSAAEAAEAASREAERRVLALRPPLIMRDLRQQETVIWSASLSDDSGVAGLALMQWRHGIDEALSLLEQQNLADDDLRTQVSSVTARVARAEVELSDGTRRVTDATRYLWSSMHDLSRELLGISEGADRARNAEDGKP